MRTPCMNASYSLFPNSIKQSRQPTRVSSTIKCQISVFSFSLQFCGWLLLQVLCKWFCTFRCYGLVHYGFTGAGSLPSKWEVENVVSICYAIFQKLHARAHAHYILEYRMYHEFCLFSVEDKFLGFPCCLLNNDTGWRKKRANYVYTLQIYCF